jgi:ParB family chromosome partitioning protein
MEASAQLKHVELSLIEVSGANPRKDLKGETFKELKASIAEHGILEPLLVRPKGKGYELVAGERRLTAAKELKLETVPVAIRDVDDHTARVLMLLENLQREDLDPLEEAAALEELLKDTGDGDMTQEELAKKLSKSQPWVANRLRLNKAPPEIKKLLEQGKISPQHVIVLLPYTEHKVLKDEIVAGLKNDLKDLEQGFGEPLTVEWAKDLAEDVLSQQGQDLELDRNYQYQGLKKFFDFFACSTCKTVLTVSGEDGKSKERACLNKTCFAERIAAARGKFAETQKEKRSKSELVNTEKMKLSEMRDYRRLDDATFDKDVCKDCPNHKLQKPQYARFGKDKDELEEICLKPSCFQGKTAQKTRMRNVACREELAFVEESLKQYLESRRVGFTWTELRFIAHRIDDSRSPKKGASIKDLEDQLLRYVMETEVRDFKYNLNLAHLKQVERDWPFAIKRKKAEQSGSQKKVQEKRKKKGAPP